MFIDDMETEGIPERILQIMRALELDTMLDICRRIKQAGQITRTADYQLERLRHQSAFRSNYEKMIMKVLELSDEQLEKLYKDVIAQGYARDEAIYKATGAEWIPFEENAALQQLITSVMKQTHDTLVNITRTTGFVNPSTMQFSDANTYFINLLDKVHTEISTGVFSYDQALNKAVSEMASSGMRWVDYNNPGKKPWHNRIDVAARRAVMTGLVQVEGQIAEENAKKLHTEYFEVSAHVTARPTHMVWQGRVYTKQQLIDICGLGTGPGLLGWNCYHHYDAFIPGISVRKYTDDQLADMRKKALETKEWKGKRYTIYEATQKQRQLETKMRACNEKIAMLKEGGASRDSITAQTIRRNDLYKEYRDFSKEFGLPEQINRVYTGINAKSVPNGSTAGSSNITPVISSNPEPVQILQASSASDISGTVNTMWKWQHDENIPEAKCNIITDSFALNGKTYKVDGHNVVNDHTDYENQIGNIIAQYYQVPVWMVPRINEPKGISVPDLFVGNDMESVDIKTPVGSGKNTLKNMLKHKKRQACTFIYDVTKTSFDDKEIKRQINSIFHSNDTRFVKEIIIMRNGRIVMSYKRK